MDGRPSPGMVAGVALARGPPWTDGQHTGFQAALSLVFFAPRAHLWNPSKDRPSWTVSARSHGEEAAVRSKFASTGAWRALRAFPSLSHEGQGQRV